MTVSSTSSVEFTIDTIVRRAMQMAGMLEPTQGTADPQWQQRSAMARDFLESDMQRLQGQGLLLKEVDFYEVTLVAAQAVYELESTTLDVVGYATYRKTGETTDLTIDPINRDEYFRTVNKDAAGRPTRYYAHKTIPFKVYVWPVPATADLGTLTFQRKRALATARDGNATPEFERAWNDYFMWILAHKLSVSAGIPLARCQYIKQQADIEFEIVSGNAKTQFAPGSFSLGHDTPWSR